MVKELEFVVNLVSCFPALLYENLFLFFTYFVMIYTFNSLFMVKKQVQYLSYDIHKSLKIMTKLFGQELEFFFLFLGIIYIVSYKFFFQQ